MEKVAQILLTFGTIYELDFRFSSVQVLKILPCRSLTSGRVEKRSGLSLEGFLRDYFQSGTPVVITNCMAHWPARAKWNHLDYLNAVAGNRTVPVEVTTPSIASLSLSVNVLS